MEDRWLWNLESSHVFYVRSAYNLLTSQPQAGTPVDTKLFWHKDIPLKVVIFVWHLFRNRLATRDNLLRRGVINNDSQLRVGGCGSLQTTSHLFSHCSIFGMVWHFIDRWLGIFAVAPHCVEDRFSQFSFLGGGSKVWQSFMHMIWFASLWEIWKERNNKIFNGKECSILQLVDKTKSLSFLWLKAKFVSFPFNYHSWWLGPFTMLGIC